MGLYDREYFREEEQPGIRARAPQTMVMTLVLINIAVYLIEMLFTDQSGDHPENKLVEFGAMYVSSLTKPWLWWQAVTSGFLHDPFSIWHVIGNMFVLWMFGRDVEKVYGKREFLRFYMTTLVFASVAWALWSRQMHPHIENLSAIGASGAVTGILTLYILHFPRRTLLLYFVVPVPAWAVGVFIIGSDLIAELNQQDNIAHSAHLAGAAFALIYYKLGWNFGRLLPDRKVVPRIRRGPKLRVHDPDQRASTLDDEADAILEKVHQQGAESLSRREKRILEDYSRRMRRKGD